MPRSNAGPCSRTSGGRPSARPSRTSACQVMPPGASLTAESKQSPPGVTSARMTHECRIAPPELRRYRSESLPLILRPMAAEQAAGLIPPENLRPAQLGIVFLGRVVLGHLSATIADLAHRGALTVAEAPGDDWLLTDQRGRSPGPSTLLPFEKSLLDGLFAGRAEVALSNLGPGLIDTLDRTRRSV